MIASIASRALILLILMGTLPLQLLASGFERPCPAHPAGQMSESAPPCCPDGHGQTLHHDSQCQKHCSVCIPGVVVIGSPNPFWTMRDRDRFLLVPQATFPAPPCFTLLRPPRA
jgi:hypothetical protein